MGRIWRLALLAAVTSGCSLVNPIINLNGTFTCYTQPRQYWYWNKAGTQVVKVQWEVDEYESDEPCPAMPIR